MTKKQRRERVEKNKAAVEAVYAAAMPERQEYPPGGREESKPSKRPFNRSRECARRIRQGLAPAVLPKAA